MKKTTKDSDQLPHTTNQPSKAPGKERKQYSRLDINAIQRAYKRYAFLYDAWFGPVMQRGRKESIDRLNCRPGDKILEVGVGTGLSLPLYPSYVEVTGIDVSPEMLQRAQARKKHLGLDNVVDLRVMDAESMEFPDDTFDKVAATYVASVVPHPDKLVNELRRICKLNGEIFILNHFQSANSAVAIIEHLLAPLSRLLGFHPDLCLDSFVKETDLDVIDVSSANLFGYWKLVRARNNKQLLGEVGEQPTIKTAVSK